MTSLSIVTPSYAPDFELCRELHRSVREFTDPEVAHHIVVPAHDRELFAELAGPRCQIVSARSVFPRRFIPTGALTRVVQRSNWLPRTWQIAAVNARHPVPPVRGWILQQLIKLLMAVEVDTDVVLLVDSDVQLVRPVAAELFVRDGHSLLYRHSNGVGADMSAHVKWHVSARRILGLPLAYAPLPDYISPFLCWDRAVLRALRARIEEVNDRSWLDVLAAQLHLSEAILYGTFAESAVNTTGAPVTTDSTKCHSYWQEAPLSQLEADRFVGGVGPDDVAVMISAKSNTSFEVRRRALSRLG